MSHRVPALQSIFGCHILPASKKGVVTKLIWGCICIFLDTFLYLYLQLTLTSTQQKVKEKLHKNKDLYNLNAH